jgi:hypothetical protein
MVQRAILSERERTLIQRYLDGEVFNPLDRQAIYQIAKRARDYNPALIVDYHLITRFLKEYAQRPDHEKT